MPNSKAPATTKKLRLNEVVKTTWNPKKLKTPAVEQKLTELDALARSTECVKYSILSVEFWLSPDGQLREWVRHNTRLAVVLAIPAFVLLPIISFGLWQLASAVSALISITGKLIVLPVLLIIVIIVWRLIKAFR